MNRLRLIPSNQTVPDWFRYRFPETGFLVRSLSYDQWLKDIKKHYQDNDIPMPDDWIARCEEQLCAVLPPGHCEYEDGKPTQDFINTRLVFDDIVNGTKVLVELASQGVPFVSQELAEARAKTCASCYLNVPVGGCGPCLAAAALVHEVAGTKHTKADQYLRTCAICHCVNRAQVWIPIDVLEKGVTAKMREQFETVPFCWKFLELKELEHENPR